jgi:hypothetical protein
MKRAGGQHLALVLGDREALSTDPYETRVPEGDNYVVGLVRAERYLWYKRKTLRLTFQIVSPQEHMGEPLYCWVNVPEKQATPAHALSRLYVAATGRKSPRNLGRLDPRSYLADSYFQARVRTVRRDMDHVERPPEASYSRVDRLLKRVEGTPPCLRERRKSSESLSQSESESQSQSGSHRERGAKTRASGTRAPALGANRARTNECAQAQVGEAAQDEPAPASSHSASPKAGTESTPSSEAVEPWILEQLSKAPRVDHIALERAYLRKFGAEAPLKSLQSALVKLGPRVERTEKRGVIRYSLRREPDA